MRAACRPRGVCLAPLADDHGGHGLLALPARLVPDRWMDGLSIYLLIVPEPHLLLLERALKLRLELSSERGALLL